MATKNCPKCDSPNPVACKKCACGHVFFATRRSANALAAESAEDISEPTTPQEPEIPRRRTARVTRERPQFYDALQVENQTRRQRELQKRRKASKSDEVDVSADDIPEKIPVASTTKRRAESPPSKVYEQPVKKRRGRPPGLTNRKTGRAQILSNKHSDSKTADGTNVGDDELENVANIHDVPPMKALQMNLVLSDINSRISSSGVKAEAYVPPAVDPDAPEKEVEEQKTEPMEVSETDKLDSIKEHSPPIKKEPVSTNKEILEKDSEDTGPDEVEEIKKTTKIVEIKSEKVQLDQEAPKGKEGASDEEAENKVQADVKNKIAPVEEEKREVAADIKTEGKDKKQEELVLPTETNKSKDIENDKKEADTKDSKNGPTNTDSTDDKPTKAKAEENEEPMDTSDIKSAKIEPKLESAEEGKEVTVEKQLTDANTNGMKDNVIGKEVETGEKKKLDILSDETDKPKVDEVSLKASTTESKESKILSS